MNDARERAHTAQVELRAHGEALNQLRNDAIAQWIDTAPTETDLREAIWRSVKNLDAVRQLVQTTAEGATLLDRRKEIRDTLTAV